MNCSSPNRNLSKASFSCLSRGKASCAPSLCFYMHQPLRSTSWQGPGSVASTNRTPADPDRTNHYRILHYLPKASKRVYFKCSLTTRAKNKNQLLKIETHVGAIVASSEVVVVVDVVVVVVVVVVQASVIVQSFLFRWQYWNGLHAFASHLAALLFDKWSLVLKLIK